VKEIKISTIVDANGRPLSAIVAPANMHDSKLYMPTVEGFRTKIGTGRPITRPIIIVADAAYDSDEIRTHNTRRGIKSNITINRRNQKKKKPGRPKNFNYEQYKKKHNRKILQLDRKL